MTAVLKLWRIRQEDKVRFVVGNGPEDILARTQVTTTTPQETLRRIIEFFRRERKQRSLRAIGIGSFGPIDLDSESPDFGFITTTPKPGWAHTNIVGLIKDALDIPVFLDTDVNAAALGEQKWGAANGLDTFYILQWGQVLGWRIVNSYLDWYRRWDILEFLII
jgi:fructokinase